MFFWKNFVEDCIKKIIPKPNSLDESKFIYKIFLKLW